MSYLLHAAQMDWSSVNPLIFGSLFEAALEKDTRHTLGAHYTGEDQINRIVYPTLVKPLLAQLAMAHNPQATYALLERIRSLRVLDPACGSGNFLFVAYRKLREVEREVLAHLREQEAQCNNLTHLYNYLAQRPYVSIRQFYGLEKNPESAELARLALVIAKELEWHHANTEGLEIYEEPLPLDDMHQNILCTDALVSYDANGNPYPTPWPAADVIIGNPPYQSKNKMQEEYGASYVDVLQQLYGNAVPGRADYCVYWFRRAHDHLPPLGRAGLVGTNTIRQNYSREGSLDYILRNGGTLTDAVASQEWPGEAAVHVSIACWTKGPATGPFTLWTETGKNGNTELVAQEVPALNASLSLRPDVTTAHVLACNQEPKLCFQGQTHGHEGFLVPAPEAERLLAQHPEYAQVLKPFLIGEELVGNPWSQPKRFVIDFSGIMFCPPERHARRNRSSKMLLH
jgi:type II restriction/modification system DNA methylase subunit YeeA